MNLKIKNKRGSVLIFTLFIMVITLVIGISMLTVALSGRRSTLASGKSVNAFQVADSGLEAILIGVKDPASTDIDSLGNCDSNEDIINGTVSNGAYRISFYDTNDDPMKCGDAVGDIVRIKSIGTYAGTSRSVETTLN